MGHRAILAVCSLRQQALDFEGNRDRIIESIRAAKERGATFRVGPELEVTYRARCSPPIFPRSRWCNL